MGQLVFQATAGGQVALVGPNPSSSFSLNVPAVNSTLATLAAQTFTGQQTDTVDASISGLTVGKGGGSVASATVVGASAMAATNTGLYNSAFGNLALSANTSGAQNTGLGQYSLATNTTGSYLVAVGQAALNSNTTGSSNTAVGQAALNSNTTASNNTAVGYQAGYSNTTGTNNVFVGQGTGYSNTTGQNNTFIGEYSGNGTTGSFNTFVGAATGYLVTSGAKNTIIGQYNGNQGGLDIRTSSNYIVLSDGDGNPRGVFDGAGNLLVGCTSLPGASVAGKALVVGSSGYYHSSCGATTTSYTHFYFTNGNGNVGTIVTNGSSTAFNTSSDYRLKENIAPMTGALAKVQALKPVTYKWKSDGSNGEGFIAHELAEVVAGCVTGEKDAVDAEGKPVYQGIDTSFLVATLTAAIQELKAEFDAYKASHP